MGGPVIHSADPPDEIREHLMAVAALYFAERDLREMVLLGPPYSVWIDENGVLNVMHWQWGEFGQPINRGLLS